jgi:hypothetical protein
MPAPTALLSKEASAPADHKLKSSSPGNNPSYLLKDNALTTIYCNPQVIMTSFSTWTLPLHFNQYQTQINLRHPPFISKLAK